MWAALKLLNNPPTTRAALEIIREDETISRDIKEILERWYKDISSLFSGLHDDPEIAFNEEFYRDVLQKKQGLRKCHLSSRLNRVSTILMK